MQKFCKDCRHYRKHVDFESKSQCYRDITMICDMVTGESKESGMKDCYIERYYKKEGSSYQFCGAEGRFWEPKD